MGSTFSTKSGFLKANHRERLLFMAAAGLAFSMLVILVVIFNFRDDASAKNAAANEANQEVPATIGTVTLFTPEQYIPAGARLADARFKEIYWPRNQVPEGAVRDLAELRKSFAKTDLPPGAPIQQLSLAAESIGTSLPMTPGNRAVTIEVDAASSIEGHALPGTRVDVVLTYQQAGELTSKVIVQNARVLSFGGDLNPAGKRTNAPQGREPRTTLTLDVSPTDALTIQTSRQLGRLSLLLRSPEDNKPNRNVEVDQNAIAGGSARQKSQQKSGSGCRKGIMKMDGKEYVIECDGSITQLMNTEEP